MGGWKRWAIGPPSESRLQHASYFVLRPSQAQGVYPAFWLDAFTEIAVIFTEEQKSRIELRVERLTVRCKIVRSLALG
jgi:hypothetical protein